MYSACVSSAFLLSCLIFIFSMSDMIRCCVNLFIFLSVQFPCAFALNLTLSKETLLRNIKNSHSPACVKPPSQDPRDASSDQGDEMDTSRTKRRFALYEKSVKDFLHYFSLEDRIVRVDTSAAQVQHVWEAMMDFFAAEMDFSANRVINTVVLFSFGKFQTHLLLIPSSDYQCYKNLPTYNGVTRKH